MQDCWSIISVVYSWLTISAVQKFLTLSGAFGPHQPLVFLQLPENPQDEATGLLLIIINVLINLISKLWNSIPCSVEHDKNIDEDNIKTVDE